MATQRRQTASKDMNESGIRPTVSIYQNPDYVAGILQQIHFQPLVTDESRERGEGSSSADKTEGQAHVGGKVGAKIPIVGDLGVEASGGRNRASDSSFRADEKTIQNFKYSQAYYLAEVRNALRQRGLIRSVNSASEARGSSSGDFVEFQATFQPSALHALLDILTPDLIAAFTEHQVKNSGLQLYPEYSSIDDLKIFAEGLFLKAQIRADIARAAAEAVRTDFRTQKTREFYGRVGDVTAITICDNAHFVVEDEDRILDGEFSVLGKITSAVEDDRPILSRNKLLNRLSPELVDSLFESLRNSANSRAVNLDLGDGQVAEIEDAFDLALPSRIDGPSFKVVPIAIFV
ncbi:DUF6414 family protein [Pseudonocardia sp. HH130630-07]|uniref:DUF6414 family protein n=1 Tax=Pseudonocardia sp. HH130630-07 TaxID=1690815 RepID=UPI000AF33F0E|nr:hypothetical protein [Pseudonocardia sp. HH130630-07]